MTYEEALVILGDAVKPTGLYDTSYFTRFHNGEEDGAPA